MNIYKGDVITFKPEYQDAGDKNLVFRAIEDMTKGRVVVVCDQQADMPIQPQFTVADYMIAEVYASEIGSWIV